MNKAQIEEMKALSKEAFGSSSRWQKYLNGKYSVLVTKDANGNEVPVLKNGSVQYQLQRPSVEELVAFMKNTVVNKKNTPI